MASDHEFVEYVVNQIQEAGLITYKKMFGEYGIYCNAKIVAFVCDNRLFVKPSEAAKTFIGEFKEAPAYTGAKMSLLIEDKIDDSEWLSELIRISFLALDTPKVKKKKK